MFLIMKDTISFLLASICKSHRTLADEMLKKECGLHVGQEMLLHILWQSNGISQSDLANKLEIQQATITKSIKRMEERGFVNREKDANDSRVSRVFLTENGINLQNNVEETWNKLENKTVKEFTLEEKILLRQLLLRVKNNLK
jgi:DNA-binding MarR family transcriptional regulator